LSTELSTVDSALDGLVSAFSEENEEKLMALTGQSDGATKNMLPKLAINYDTDTEDGKSLKKGTWRIQHEGRFVYAETVTIRPFMRTFFWSLWDSEEGRSVSSSIQKTVMSGDFPDSMGGNKCGRLSKDEVEALPDDDPRVITSKAVNCNQLLYCVVTGTFKDADGKEVILDEVPAMSYFKRSGFMPVNNFINNITSGTTKRIMQKVEINLKTSRLKKGSVTFFVPVLTEHQYLDGITENDKSLMSMFADTIKATNAGIMNQYREAVKLQSSSEDTDLSKDFDADAA
tara:strand:+ start:1221 stop:2081 length:861 start_codon:yes stop_codon:yes gene_type:complete